MKNEKTINPEIFLPKQADKQNERPKLYNLEEEFAKLKKNRNYFRSFLFILTISAIFALTFYGIKFIQDKNSRIKINIKEFEDINLVEVLSTVKMYEKDLSKEKTELETMVSERDDQISILTESTNNRIKIINGASYSAVVKRKKIRALRVALWKKIAKIKGKYKDQIKQKRSKIDELTKKIESYDQKELQQAKKSEEVLSSQEKLHDMDIQSTKNEYEKKLKNLKKYYTERIKNLEDYSTELSKQLTFKYNPIIEDEEINTVLKEKSKDIKEKLRMGEYRNKGVINDELYSQIVENNKKINLLLGILSKIPYKNSMPKLISRINSLKKEIVSSYEEIGVVLSKNNLELTESNAALTTENKNLSQKSQINETQNFQYNSALQNMLTKANVSGFVIDAKNSKNIFFVLKKGIKINSNQSAEVLGNDNKPIATIIFYYEGGLLKAKLDSLYSNTKIQPMNVIKINQPNE